MIETQNLDLFSYLKTKICVWWGLDWAVTLSLAIFTSAFFFENKKLPLLLYNKKKQII